MNELEKLEGCDQLGVDSSPFNKNNRFGSPFLSLDDCCFKKCCKKFKKKGKKMCKSCPKR